VTTSAGSERPASCVLQVREHLEGDRQLGLDVIIVGVSHSACVLVVLGESAAPQMMSR
jgi:hypothetical protein